MTFYCLYSYSEGAHVQEAQYLIFRLVSWSDKDYLCDIKKKKNMKELQSYYCKKLFS